MSTWQCTHMHTHYALLSYHDEDDHEHFNHYHKHSIAVIEAKKRTVRDVIMIKLFNNKKAKGKTCKLRLKLILIFPVN